MEASALKHASRRGLLARRSPLLRLQGDERLIAMIRAGHDRAFEVLFDRYHARLLAFCRHMLNSSEDAEDVLQDVFTNAHAAILGDDRAINVRPWLYRIARNRCLNHLRKPTPEGQDSMDVHPHEGGTTTAERVQRREDFRALVADVQDLPETQRTALLLREIDALSYDEIAESMDTTVPAVKSLLVRARMSLAEATQSRVMSCGDVQLELAEAAEGLRKASGAVRHHVRRCEECREYRTKLRSNGRELSSLAPALLLVWLHKAFGAGLFGLGQSAGAAGAAAAGSGAAGAAAAGSGAAACGGAAAGAAAGGAAGGISGLLCSKAAAGLATAALVTAGAVEVRHLYNKDRTGPQGTEAAAVTHGAAEPQGGPPVVAVPAAIRDEPRDGGDAGATGAGEPAEASSDESRSDGDGDGGGAEPGLVPASASADAESASDEASEAAEETSKKAADEGEDDEDSSKKDKGDRRARGSTADPERPPVLQPCESPTDGEASGTSGSGAEEESLDEELAPACSGESTESETGDGTDEQAR